MIDINKHTAFLSQVFIKRKKLFVGLIILITSFFLVNNFFLKKKTVNSSTKLKSQIVAVGKSFDFPALNSKGKRTKNKINFKIIDVEKTNQVVIKDQTFIAKNNKMFFIIHLALKNDKTEQLNILPGDLVRLTYEGDEENKFAPDLHNNLVPIAAISTKLDRLGFVVPEEVNSFKLHVGELEGKKEVISITFPS